MSVRRRAASVYRNQSWYKGSLHLLLMAQLTTKTYRPLRGPTLNAAGSLIYSEDKTITTRLFNAKSRLTSWPHLAPAFCGQRKTGVNITWSHFSQLMMWNNIGITSCVKHQQIHFCSAVLIATCKQRNYSCPNSSSYTLRCCVLYSTVFCCINMIVWRYGSRCCEHQTIQNGLGAVITWELGHYSSPLTCIDCFE